MFFSRRHDPLDVRVGEVFDREALRVLERVVAVVALGVGGRLVVDDAVGLGGHRVEMLGEGRPVHRREEVVGHHEAVGVAVVGRERIAVVLRVAGHVLAQRDAVEAVHLPAVDRQQAWVEGVAQVVRDDLRRRRERHRLGAVQRGAVHRPAFGGTVDPGVLPEVVVEAPVLLDHEHDVLDGVLARHDHAYVVVPAVAAPVVLPAPGGLATCLFRGIAAGPQEPHQANDEDQHERREHPPPGDLLPRRPAWSCGTDGGTLGLHDGAKSTRRSALQRGRSARHPAAPAPPRTGWFRRDCAPGGGRPIPPRR